MYKSIINNLCIDIGGSFTRVALVSNDEIKDVVKFKTNTEPQLNFNQIADIISSWSYDGVAIATAGPINNNIYGRLPNLPNWENFKIDNKLFAGKPLVVENDANCSAYFEHDNRLESTLFVTVSTGIGGGFVLNDEIYLGSSGKGLEIHNILFSDAGSAEQKCSGTGLFKQALAAGLEIEGTKELFELQSNNEVAMSVIKEGQQYLILLINNLIAILNPSQVVLGGSVITNNQAFFYDIKLGIEKKINCQVKIKMAEEPEYNTLLGVNKILNKKMGELK